MSLDAFQTAMEDLVVTDPEFITDIEDLLGDGLTVLRGSRELRQIPSRSRPCVVFEQGDAEAAALGGLDDESLTIGSFSQGFEAALLMAVIWDESDIEIAYRQRTLLLDIFVKLMLRNPAPGGVNGAWVASATPDRGTRHPLQIWHVELRAELEISRL